MEGQIACVKDYERWANSKLPLNSKIYFNSGATEEQTLRDNEAAYKRWRFRPRVLRDVSHVDMNTRVFGTEITLPICIAPTALHKILHDDGEIATAKAALKHNVGFTLSTYANTTLEEIAEKVPGVVRWFQTHIFKNTKLTEELVVRAEKAGFTGLVLTVDSPVNGKKNATIKFQFKLPEKQHPVMVPDKIQKQLHETFLSDLTARKSMNYGNVMYSQNITWEDIDWIKTKTKLPIVVKGILTREMALEAIQHGVDGILVSNHGARQLDGVFATIDVLPEIVEAVAGRCDVYMDGGVRTGSDAVKAIALGAKAVFIGRPVLWGLACQGEIGVNCVLEILRDEFKETMQLLGVSSIKELQNTGGLIVHETYLQRHFK